ICRWLWSSMNQCIDLLIPTRSGGAQDEHPHSYYAFKPPVWRLQTRCLEASNSSYLASYYT
ncbi:MAG: hypothetical protein K2O54_00500, partial [Prevotella sp.]|nr:hypothetical protein [Prevotella sp.]